MLKNIPVLYFLVLVISSVCGASTVLAKGVYQTPKAFLQEAFPDGTPRPEIIWLSGERKAQVEKILGHPYSKLRVKYWKKGQHSAWILDEIGKEKPITTGFVIDGDKITTMHVLIFRESRGWEVKYPFFTRQFKGVMLDDHAQLDRGIDGVTGATLSVNAITRLSRMALYLNHSVQGAGH
ncbi:MAG TPA: FMN-binding protein [Gammaproteobacteria bacterium]|nr:FMN-binding protein [Gammaproteobacteria bacterium]